MAVLEENYVAERHVESFSFWLHKSQDLICKSAKRLNPGFLY